MGRSVTKFGFEKDERIGIDRVNLASEAIGEGAVIVLAEIHLPSIHHAEVIGAQQARRPVCCHVPYAMLPPHTISSVAPGMHPLWVDHAATGQLRAGHALCADLDS